MEAVEFRTAWEASGDQLCEYAAEAISASRLPESTKRFLLSAGLPREAAPFLSFGQCSLDWLGQRGGDLNYLYPLGCDGSGDPLVLDQDGVVWLVDHEAPSRRTFVNSSVSALAECLLVYRHFVVEVVASGGEDAFLDRQIPKSAVDALFRSIGAIDSAGLRAESFWDNELSRLSSEAGA